MTHNVRLGDSLRPKKPYSHAVDPESIRQKSSREHFAAARGLVRERLEGAIRKVTTPMTFGIEGQLNLTLGLTTYEKLCGVPAA